MPDTPRKARSLSVEPEAFVLPNVLGVSWLVWCVWLLQQQLQDFGVDTEVLLALCCEGKARLNWGGEASGLQTSEGL